MLLEVFFVLVGELLVVSLYPFDRLVELCLLFLQSVDDLHCLVVVLGYLVGYCFTALLHPHFLLLLTEILLLTRLYLLP